MSTSNQPSYANLPQEFLGGYWAAASLELVPYTDREGVTTYKRDKRPRHPVTGVPLSVAHPQGGSDELGNVYPAWCTFAEAAACGAPAIGKLLLVDDGYTVLDLDDMSEDDRVPEHLRASYWQYQERLLDQAFPLTYTEVSVSGKGLHAIYKASLRAGRRASRESEMVGAELYGHGRFMICTGNAWRNVPIAPAQDQVQRVADAISQHGGTEEFVEAELPGALLTPEQLKMKLWNAKNNDKFQSLFVEGYSSKYADPDRSTTDSMFAQMMAWYQPSLAAFLEVWRTSALWRVGADGRVDKPGYHSERVYVRNYITRTWEFTVGRAIANRQHEAQAREDAAKLAARAMESMAAPQAAKAAAPVADLAQPGAALAAGGETLPGAGVGTATGGAAVGGAVGHDSAPEDEDEVVAGEEQVFDDAAANWATEQELRDAPGLVGFGTRDHHDHRVIRNTPVPGYIGHLLAVSTIMGFAFRGTFKDRADYANLQIMALLPASFGKEDMLGVMQWAVDVARNKNMFVGLATAYPSAQGAHTAFSSNPYQCYIEDEAGRKAQQQRKAGGDPHQMGLATFFMELHSRYMLAEKSYSDRANNKAGVPHVYGTMLKMSQPETLAPTLEKANLVDGLLTRPYFIHVPTLARKRLYGSRPHREPHPLLKQAYSILADWAAPANQTAGMAAACAIEKAKPKGVKEVAVEQPYQMPAPIDVTPSPEAETIYAQFDDFCETQVVTGYPIWGRAAQNAKRLAMVLAVGEAALETAEAVSNGTRHLGPAPRAITISRSTMVWACREIAYRLRSLGAFATNEMHSSDDSRIASTFLDLLKRNNGDMTAANLVETTNKNARVGYDKAKLVLYAMVESGKLLSSLPLEKAGHYVKTTRISLPARKGGRK